MSTAATAYLAILVFTAFTSYSLHWVWRWFATKRGIIKQPGKRDRDIHKTPTPNASGIAMFAAFLLAMLIAWQMPFFRGVFRDSSEPLGVVLGASIIVAIQFIDDLRDLSPPAKLAGVVLGASVMYFFGLSMFYFRIPFAGFVVLAPDVAPLMTVLWVAGMTQAVNLIDGLDGLAAGVVAIAAAAFTIYAQRLSDGGLLAPENIGPLLAVIACGLCLGYLPHNVHPAKVFMADSGAYLLGVLMAASTLVVGGRIADQFSGQTYFFYAPIFIPLFILGVPIIDVAWSIIRRTRKGGGVSAADSEHIHHRLMRLGHGTKRAVYILWAWTALLSGFVLAPTFGEGNANFLNRAVPFAVAGLGLALFTLFHPGIRDRSRADHPATQWQENEPAN
jgi:UDP-GlcNAc:undecaprenyl-phosphate/decaprenyl-phosphate GlcNAc-1-phosphate transferase